MISDWQASYEALHQILSEGAYSNLAINKALAKHKEASPGFVRVQVKGVLRTLIPLEHLLQHYTREGREPRPRTKQVLFLGLYALSSMEVPEHAAVNDCVELARRCCPGQMSFINAVLRRFVREGKKLLPEEEGAELLAGSSKKQRRLHEIARLSLRYSFPEALVGLLHKEYGEETERILASLNEVPELALRVNRLKTNRSELAEMLREEGILTVPDPETEAGLLVRKGSPLGGDLFRRGYFSVQSSSSLRAIEALDPQPGERVLDLCAAPGGKSAAMAERMNNQGEIVSCDLHAHRVHLIEEQMKRLGITIVRAEQRDAALFREEDRERFDRVLADVPCSGIGVIGSKPELRYHVDLGRLPELIELQKQILRHAAAYVKPGGVVVYSTCTINIRENEEVTEAVLSESPMLTLVETQRIMPYNKNAGFFFACLRKNGRD